jgi:hypothetical protein
LTVAAVTAVLLFVGVYVFGPSAEVSNAATVGPNGQISGCLKKKGKRKGTLRVVKPGKRCKKKERAISWAQAGTPGPSGPRGAEGTRGPVGPIDPDLAGRVSDLEAQVAALQDLVTQQGLDIAALQGILQNVSNQDLLDAVDAVAKVDTLCFAMANVVDYADALQGVLDGLALGGTIPVGLNLTKPTVPPTLGGFSCTPE